MLLPRLLVFGGGCLLLLVGSGAGGSFALAAGCRGGSSAVAPAAGCPAVSPVLMVLGSALYLDGMRGFQSVSRGGALPGLPRGRGLFMCLSMRMGGGRACSTRRGPLGHFRKRQRRWKVGVAGVRDQARDRSSV